MNQKMTVKCKNCNKENDINLDELVSEMPLKDDLGNIVKEHIKIELDSRLLVACQFCRYPILCQNI